MRRRSFLQLTLVSAAALATGCGNDDETPVDDGSELFPQSVASGDPTASTVILWTRIEDPEADGDIDLELQISKDEDFSDAMSQTVTAEVAHDMCVKVRVTDLEPSTHYYYRFIRDRDGRRLGSRTGRTKTAPDPGDDASVRFAFVSCQDFNGRFYGVYELMARDEDLDFIVHLGDYIYETTGNPEFQSPTDDRRVTLTDTAGAIVFNEGTEAEYFAAKSLDNYRELYKIYRGDASLQRIHERFPMLCIWDDHEFSNDCHGATGTYFSGEQDEEDVQRRKDANQAWWEYMPVDWAASGVGDADFEYDPSAEFPGDIRIYRDFQFGQHVHLVLTDERTWRSDHPVAEGAFPGGIAVTEADIQAALGSLPDEARPYVNIDDFDGGSYRDAIVAAAEALEIDPAAVSGNVSVDWINDVAEDAGVMPIDEAGQADLERGVSYFDIGKSGMYTSFGSRSLAAKAQYDIMGEVQWINSAGESEHVLGAEQEAWFVETINGSSATWKVWGNEFALSPLPVDLSSLQGIPAQFATEFYITTDLWDGHRQRRDEILRKIAGADGVVAITGDIHAFHAGLVATHDESSTIFEFITSSISSATFSEELNTQVETNPALANFPTAAALVSGLDEILHLGNNPYLAWSNSKEHGFITIEADGAGLTATATQVPAEAIPEDWSDRVDSLADQVVVQRFRVEAGSTDLQGEFDGAWLRWDPSSNSWV